MGLESGVKKLKGLIKVLEDDLNNLKSTKFESDVYKGISVKICEMESKRIILLKKIVEILESD